MSDGQEHGGATELRSPAHQRIAGLIDAGRCVVLDGGDRHRAAARSPRARARSTSALWGTRRARSTPPTPCSRVHRALRRGGLRRDLDEHLGPAERAAATTARGCGTSTRPVHWMDVARARPAARAPRRSARPDRDGECAVAFSLNGDVDCAGGRRDDPAARAPVRRRARPTSILLETLSLLRPSLVRDGRGAARRPGLPVWLSFRRCRHGLCGVYGAALGRPGGRRVRARRAALRGDGRGRAARQLHPARPRRRDGRPTCATSPTCRSASIPTSATSRTTAGASTPGVGGEEYARDGAAAGARRARRSSAAAAASGPSTSPPPASAWRAPCPGTRRPAADPARERRRARRRGRRAPRRGPTAAAARCTRCRSPTSSCDPGRLRPERRQLHGLALPLRRGHRRAPALPGHRLRHRASSPSSSRSTARRTCTRSTSTSAPWPTR